MPAARQASISAARIGREASCTSVSPRQNFLKPPPVPEMPTVTRTLPRFMIWNSSATASVIGNTVLDPSILMTWASAVAGADRESERGGSGCHQQRECFHSPSILLISLLI